jgi:alkylation response protein AidB-like acyl-CoA dehydrogenase
VKFLFDEDQELLRESARGLLARLFPSARVRELAETTSGFDPDGWRRIAELGLFSMLVPEKLGGGSLTEQGMVDAVVLAEEVGRGLVPGPFVSSNVAALALAEGGSAEHQELLLDVISGEQIVTWCHVDADAPSGAEWDPATPRLTAQADGEHVVLSGTKLYVEAADVADQLLVSADLDGRAGQLLVPVATAGVTIERHAILDLTRRLHAVTFTGVRVPASAVLPGADDAALERQLQAGAILVSADSVGAGDRVFEMTLEYLKQRHQFGRPIASFQAIKHRMADLLALLENARAATHYAALAFADDRADTALAIGVAKAYTGDAYQFITGESTQLHGGMGFTWEHDTHLFERRGKVNAALFGPAGWHRRRIWADLQGRAARKGNR